ncbi:PREDICTED: uncharacterized protein LOC104819749 [Tarenaya hassleriana]|uniref:uncharacterized protein LOC104819749 n=1 Tax=Tarenaya hassleriana TaxID=28532 RepID=UPI00053C9329|nr:PREDICTED: uncharacterized protein LOC104819749 [Tarenaya hassleriana]
MGDLVKQILARPIQLADQVVKTADEATINKQECSELKSKTEKLSTLLRQAARASSDLYERPTRRIIDDIEQVLEKALSMVNRSRDDGFIMRLFNIIPASAFRKMSAQLSNSAGDVSWLLRVSAPAGELGDGDSYLGLPPIAANEPILCLIWEQIAILMTGSPEDRSDAAASLASLARDNDRYGRLIIEEGGVNPLLRLLKEGKIEGQENAARAIGLLGRDSDSVEQMVHLGVCQVLANILKEGSMKVQAVVAWAVSELAGNHPKCQEIFAQHNVVRLLVSHLAFETVQEHSKYAVVAGRATSMHHAIVMASKTSKMNSQSHDLLMRINEDDDHSPISRPIPNQMHDVVTTTMAMKSAGSNLTLTAPEKPEKSNSINAENGMKTYYKFLQSRNASATRGRELEDPVTKSHMKAMAARALWKLASANASICHVITESRALLCFAVLLEKGDQETKYNSAMAVMEITAVAEQNADLRRSAFRRTSPACKAVVDQLFWIVDTADSESELLIPCIKSFGNLARTFKSAETQMIIPLVKLLDGDREPDVAAEAAIALTKFVSEDNFLCKEHSRTIIGAGVGKHLVQLAYLGEGAQIPALVLLSYVAMNAPDSEELAKDEVLTVLEWASKQSDVTEDDDVESLLSEAKSRLELYQSR